VKRILLVEDERLVLMGIASLFQEASGDESGYASEYEIAGSYTNPLKALKALPSAGADILITDINMPQMSGLELIRKAKEFNPKIHVVVLSCYDDFSIVSKAFKLGIDDYILKHEVEKETLFPILEGLQIPSSTASQKQEQEQKQQQEQEQLQPNSVNTQNIESAIEEITANPDSSSRYMLALLAVKKQYSRDYLPRDSSVNIYWCQQFVQNLLDEADLGQACMYRNQDVVCILKADEKLTRERNRFLRQIHSQLAAYINSPLIVIHTDLSSREELADCWNHLAEKRDIIFYTKEHAVLRADAPEWVFDEQDICFPPLLEIFSYDFEQNWMGRMKLEADAVITRKTAPSVLCMDILLYYHEAEQLTERLFGSPLLPREDETGFFATLQNFDDAGMLLRWFMQYIASLHASAASYSGQRSIVIRIKIFLHAHYTEHISLATLSEHFHLNEHYLCEIFRKDAGIGFVEYLHNVRIDAARKLLEQTDETAEAISDQTGFSNASHFSKVFKRITGMTLSEYRDQCRGRRQPVKS